MMNVMIFKGGAWCTSDAECAERAQTAYGSSVGLAKKARARGPLSSDAAVNRALASWSAVWLLYCDGASLSANVSSAVLARDESALFYRGAYILDALLAELREPEYNLGGATDVLLAGRLVFVFFFSFLFLLVYVRCKCYLTLDDSFCCENAGGSAGGLAALLHADRVAAALPSQAKFGIFVISG